MTTILAPSTASRFTNPPATGLRVSQSRVVLSEWTKFRSLRSTPYTLLAATLTPVGPVGSVVAIHYIERRNPAPE